MLLKVIFFIQFHPLTFYFIWFLYPICYIEGGDDLTLSLRSCRVLGQCVREAEFFFYPGILAPFKVKLSILFRFVWNDRNISYQFKKRNKTKQFSSHFKSRSVPDFSAKFRPECSNFIPHVPFRSWKAIESNWTWFNLIY